MRLSNVASSAALAALVLGVAACGDGATTASSATPAGSGAPKALAAGSAKPAAGAGKVVDLAPLPHEVTLPADEAGVTMNKTMNGLKSVDDAKAVLKACDTLAAK